MKLSRSVVDGKARNSLTLRFESHNLTSFAGLVVFQRLFAALNFKDRLWRCFRHLRVTPLYGHHRILMLLIVHVLMGYRELREIRYYCDDALVKRVLGLKRLPDVSTITRSLASADTHSVVQVRKLSSELVLERLGQLKPARITLDFDGSVLSTRRYAQGVAVGFNKKRKGARSYYPLLCTVAQTDQVLDVHHRPGNVHDSNGAREFIEHCAARLDTLDYHVHAEARMDSAFFSEEIVQSLNEQDIEFCISVPFERFAELKQLIAQPPRAWWRDPYQRDTEYFEHSWKPQSWQRLYRFVFIRQRVKRQSKEPVQLDLFELNDFDYEHKVIVTNKTNWWREVLQFHEGRGSQESLIGQLKSHCQMDYVPARSEVANQLFLLANVFAHNLSRELQMHVEPPKRSDHPKRSPLWDFQQLRTLRRHVVQRAGRLIRPAGKPTLVVNANAAVEKDISHYLNKLARRAAA